MKILHILDHSLPLHSGYTFRSQNILRSQCNRGWTPVVLTSPKQEDNWNGEWNEKDTIDDFIFYRTVKIRKALFPLEPEVKLIISLAKRIEEVIRYEKPAILHAHSPVLNALAALHVGRKLRIPVVYEIRAFWEDAAVDHGTYTQKSWKYRVVRSLETWASRMSNEVITICNGLRDDLVIRGVPSSKITIIGNGVNVEDFQSCVPDESYRDGWKIRDKKVIGFIGSFYHYEGLDLLCDAFARMAGKRPDIALLLVGGGNMENELRQRIRKLKIEDRVIMPGRIPHDRIQSVYSLIDILAYPRYSMRLTELVTPLKPLEAMAMGKALVASDIGGHRELIHHGRTGILFPPGNVVALEKALSNLLDDDNTRKILEEEGPKWVRQTRTWEKTTAGYSEVYSRALFPVAKPL